MEALLSTTYFGPLEWYEKLNRYDTCIIEQHEHYIKQTLRNRCVIASANGPLALTVPVQRNSSENLSHVSIKDIKISTHGNWQHQHRQALVSAYGESSFFEYYADDLHIFFEKRWKYLLDFNLQITNTICELLDIQPNITYTIKYTKIPDNNILDFRNTIKTIALNKPDMFIPKPYYQVYKEKNGFLPNLSILDLLFNMGNESVLYL